MSCSPCQKDYLPFQKFYDQCVKALELGDAGGVAIAPIIAICYAESSCTPYYADGDLIAGKRLQEMANETGVSIPDFKRLLSVPAPVHKMLLPKFEFQRIWWDLVQQNARYKNLTPVEKAIVSCSVGLGGQSMYYYSYTAPPDQIMPRIKAFASEPWMQILQVHDQLVQLGFDGFKNFGLIATRYNAGPDIHVISEYGRRAEAFRATLTAKMKQRGVKECSPIKSAPC